MYNLYIVESFYLLVGDVEQRVIGWVVAEVKHVGVQAHVSVDVIALEIVEKRIRVSKAELSIVAVLGFDVAVVEVVHQELREDKNGKPNKDWVIQHDCGLQAVSCSQMLTRWKFGLAANFFVFHLLYGVDH